MAIVSEAKVATDVQVVAAWTVRDHGLDGGGNFFLGENRLDKSTGSSKPRLPPVFPGYWIRFDGRLGRIETERVEPIVADFLGRPSEICYRVPSGRTIPRTWVVGVEGRP